MDSLLASCGGEAIESSTAGEDGARQMLYEPEDQDFCAGLVCDRGGKTEPLVAGVIDGPGAYQEAWQQLEARYGGQNRHLEKQIRAIIDQRKSVSELDYSALQGYAIKLQSTMANMKMCGTAPGAELYLLATERVPREVLMKFFLAHGEHTTDVNLFPS